MPASGGFFRDATIGPGALRTQNVNIIMLTPGIRKDTLGLQPWEDDALPRDASLQNGAINSEIRAIRTDTLASLVQRHMQHAILNGELRPGDKVNEVGIARELEVSRGPVREACGYLVASGLLVAKAQRGVFVKRVTFAEAEALYEVRIALYVLAGSLLAERISNQEISALGAIVRTMEKALKRRDLASYYPLSEEFHRSLLSAAGNAKLTELFFDCWHQMRLFRLGEQPAGETFPDQATDLFADSLEGRKQTVTAVRTRNAKRIKTAMRNLAQDSWRRTQAIYMRNVEGSGQSFSHKTLQIRQ